MRKSAISSRSDVDQVRRSEKASIQARAQRILEFPRTMSPREVAKALKEEGHYSQRTSVYHIEYRVRRLRTEARRIEHNGSSS
jgi:hypothetical protein